MPKPKLCKAVIKGSCAEFILHIGDVDSCTERARGAENTLRLWSAANGGDSVEGAVTVKPLN